MQAGRKGAARLLSSTIGVPPKTTLLPPYRPPKTRKIKKIFLKIVFFKEKFTIFVSWKAEYIQQIQHISH